MTKNKCAAPKQWDQRNTYSFKYRKPYQDHSDSTRFRSMFWMKSKAYKHVRGLEDMAPNPECFRFGHGQKNVKKIARKSLANLDVDLASQALGQTEIAAKPGGMPGSQPTSCQPLSEKITSPILCITILWKYLGLENTLCTVISIGFKLRLKTWVVDNVSWGRHLRLGYTSAPMLSGRS